jgi:hypothetical protein
MGYFKRSNITSGNCRPLSILFMGYKANDQGLYLMQPISFNSLYGILKLASLSFRFPYFQFPLWDTYILSVIASERINCFQFPLWDTRPRGF